MSIISHRLSWFPFKLLLSVLLFCSTAFSQNASVQVVYLTPSELASGNLNIPLMQVEGGINVQNIRVHQLNILNNVPQILFSTEAMLIFLYTSAVPLFLTIGAERLGIGFTYVTQNLYVAAALTLAVVAIRFDLQALGIVNGTPWPASALMRIYFHYATAPSPSPPPTFMQYDLPVAGLDDDASNLYGDPTPGTEPVINSTQPPPNLGSPITSSAHYGCTVPNIDLDAQHNQPRPGYAGDQNACGPAAASNSMLWLASAFPSINLPFSHRALLDSLSRYMGRPPSGGVNIQTFVRGKLDFIRRHSLPLRVKFQAEGVSGNINDSEGMSFGRNDNSGAYPTWQFLKNEMADSEDVEVFYKWFDGASWRSHAVTVSGAYETGDGKKYIGIKHDVKQRDTGGTVQEFPEVVVDQYGRMILHRHGRPRYISHVISESPGPPFLVNGIGEGGSNPDRYALEQNYPNPFNPATRISFSLGKREYTTLRVYDVLGREVASLLETDLPVGPHTVEFNAARWNLASGVYYYRLVSGNFVATKTMMIMK